MADDDIPDYGDMDDFLDWLYVEDDFPLADELAESQIPDPGYAGTKHEIDMEGFDDYDCFEFWDDLEYGHDNYWDYDDVRSRIGVKRKRHPSAATTSDGKRRKMEIVEMGGDNVRFVHWTARIRMLNRRPPVGEKLKSFALFPDWKKRFANVDGAALKKEMPADMRMAAEGQNEDTSPPGSPSHVGEDGDEDDTEDTQDVMAELGNMDMDMLKSVLRQRMGEAGLEGMDENAFMHAISKMLSGEENSDDVTNELTSSLLDRATEGNDEALSGWLSGQGVSLQSSEAAEDEANPVATPIQSEPIEPQKERNTHKDSPSDSAIEMMKGIGGAASTEMPIHSPSPTTLSKKRAAPTAKEASPDGRKRKKVSFDMPSPSTASSSLTQGNGHNLEAKPDPPTSEDPLVSEPHINGQDATTSEVASVSEPTIHNERARAAKTKAANAIAVQENASNHSTADGSNTTSLEASSLSEDGPQTDLGTEGDETAAASSPARNTRKRKAEAEKPAPKKQARKASAPAQTTQPRARTTRAAAKASSK